MISRAGSVGVPCAGGWLVRPLNHQPSRDTPSSYDMYFSSSTPYILCTAAAAAAVVAASIRDAPDNCVCSSRAAADYAACLTRHPYAPGSRRQAVPCDSHSGRAAADVECGISVVTTALTAAAPQPKCGASSRFSVFPTVESFFFFS